MISRELSLTSFIAFFGRDGASAVRIFEATALIGHNPNGTKLYMVEGRRIADR